MVCSNFILGCIKFNGSNQEPIGWLHPQNRNMMGNLKKKRLFSILFRLLVRRLLTLSMGSSCQVDLHYRISSLVRLFHFAFRLSSVVRGLKWETEPKPSQSTRAGDKNKQNRTRNHPFFLLSNVVGVRILM